MPQAIERWIVVIAGFRQEGRLSGMDKIQNALRRKCRSDDTVVILKSWQDSMDHLAERMHNWRPLDHQPRVVLIGFSYGGYSAVLLSRILEKYGWEVELMLLVDPVWRYLAWLPSALSLLSRWRIKVPDTVKVLYSWHQSVGKPSGHRLKVNEQTTSWVAQTLTVPHNAIDDVQSIKDRALLMACPGKTL